jgi:hypothetical protein
MTLTIADILAWADAHQERTGRWPGVRSGAIGAAPGRTWQAVDSALRRGLPGAEGCWGLAPLLAAQRGVRNRAALPALTEKQIVAWAQRHFQRTGAWPTSASGPIFEVAGETWQGVHQALRQGHRGLPGGSSLARLLEQAGCRRNRRALPGLTVEQITAWAAAHARRTSVWPTRKSGPVVEAPGETWKGLDQALQQGHRRLPGGSSLARVIRDYRNLLLEARR